MKTLNLHPLQIIALALACQVALLLSGPTLLAQAQEPSPFQISIRPAADHAVSGQPFTYTVVITNVSDAPVQYASVDVLVPEGMKLLQTKYSNPKWYGGNSFTSPELEAEQVRLLSPEIIEVGEVFSFEMIVDVIAETNTNLTISEYDAISIEDNISTTGPPIQVAVREPTPTPTPTLLSSPTVIPSATATSIPTTPQAAVVAMDVPVNNIGETNADSAMSSTSASHAVGPMTATIIIIAVFILIFTFIGVMWFLRKR